MKFSEKFLQAWAKEFGYLDEFGLGSAYRLILVLASSKTNLTNWLTEELPSNCRLLRKDQIALEQFWVEQFYGNNPPKGRRCSLELVEKMAALLQLEIGQNNLVGYYADRLNANREKVDYRSDCSSLVAFIRVNCLSYYDRIIDQRVVNLSFKAKLFNGEFGITCFYDLASLDQELIIKIIVPRASLTEALTHTLLTKLPPSKKGRWTNNRRDLFTLTSNSWHQMADVWTNPEIEDWLSGTDVDFYFKVICPNTLQFLCQETKVRTFTDSFCYIQAVKRIIAVEEFCCLLGQELSYNLKCEVKVEPDYSFFK